MGGWGSAAAKPIRSKHTLRNYFIITKNSSLVQKLAERAKEFLVDSQSQSQQDAKNMSDQDRMKLKKLILDVAM